MKKMTKSGSLTFALLPFILGCAVPVLSASLGQPAQAGLTPPQASAGPAPSAPAPPGSPNPPGAPSKTTPGAPPAKKNSNQPPNPGAVQLPLHKPLVDQLGQMGGVSFAGKAMLASVLLLLAAAMSAVALLLYRFLPGQHHKA